MVRRPVRRSAVRIVRYRAVPPQRTDGALALNAARSAAARPGVRSSPEVRSSPGALRLVRPGAEVEAEVRALAEATLRIVVEVLAGTRPPHQLSLIAVPAVCRGLAAQRGPHHRAAPGGARRIVPPRVLSSRVQRPSRTTVEASAVVVLAGRVHALALRLEHLRGRWRCTAVETTAA